MKSKGIWATISLLIILSLMLFSCTSKTTTSTTAKSSTTATTTSATATSAHWWDKFGEPKYGGTLIFRYDQLPAIFDPDEPLAAGGMLPYWCEHLFMHDWTYDRSQWDFKTSWAPANYWSGVLVDEWEWQDPQTMLGHVRQGVHWTKNSPANGRALIASDIQFHYDRLLGTGSGFTQAHPFLSGWLRGLEKVSAIDDKNVEFKFTTPSPFMNFMTISDVSSINMIECPDSVKAGIKDINNSAGTGAFTPGEFIEGNSLTLIRNPDYWGYDERYPQNKLPYADEIKMLSIPDTATALAALRTDKIFLMSGIDWQQSENLKKTDPDLQQSSVPGGGMAINMRCDTAPFTDINVRKALNMAVDRKSIAKSYYGGTVDGIPAGLVSPIYNGWYIPFDEWPAELQEGYTFDPEKAKALLAEAGYPGGFNTNCIASTGNDLQLLQLIQAGFKDIGVDMEIRSMDPMTFTNMVSNRQMDQMSVGGWCGMPRPPQIGFNDLTSKGGLNGTLNNDVNYDSLVDKFSLASDEDSAKALSIEIDMYTLEHYWGVLVCPTAGYSVWSPHLKGYSGETTGFIWDWYFTRLWYDAG